MGKIEINKANRAEIKRLVAAAMAQGLSAKQLAELCKVTPSAISAWKNGKSMGSIAQRALLGEIVAKAEKIQAGQTLPAVKGSAFNRAGEKVSVVVPEKPARQPSKLRIIEVCAMPNCENPRLSGGLCENHGEEAAAKGLSMKEMVKAASGRKAAEAKWDELAKAHAPMRAHTQELVQKIEATKMGRKALAKELGITGTRITRYAKGEAAAEPAIRAQMGDILARREIEAEAKAKAKAAKAAEKKAPKASKPRAERPAKPENREKTENGKIEAKQLVLALRGAGKDDEFIAKVAGVSTTTPVLRWAEGSSAGQTYQRRNLRKAAEKLGVAPESGSIKLASPSKAARDSKRVKEADPRQLILQLKSQLKALQKQMKA